MSECYDIDCEFHERRHVHHRTTDGSYVKFIVEKPKVIDRPTEWSDENGTTRRQW